MASDVVEAYCYKEHIPSHDLDAKIEAFSKKLLAAIEAEVVSSQGERNFASKWRLFVY